MRIQKVIEVYNESYHSSIEMTPDQAMDQKNWDTIKNRQECNAFGNEALACATGQ